MKYRNKIIRFCLILLLLYLLNMYFNTNTKYVDMIVMRKSLVVAFIGWLLYIFKYEPNTILKKQYLTISLTFLLGFIPTCFQYYYLYVEGIVDDLSLGYYLNEGVITKSALLSSIGLLAYFIGNVSRVSVGAKVSVLNIDNFTNRYTQRIAIVLFCLYILVMPWVYFLGNYGNYALKVPGVALFVQQFYHYFVIASIALQSYHILSSDIKTTFLEYVCSYDKKFIIVLVIYVLLTFMSGDRDPIITTAGTFVLSYFLISKIYFSLVKTVCIAGVTIPCLFVIGIVRSLDFGADTVVMVERVLEYVDAQDMALAFTATDEFARVIRAQHAIIMYVDEYGFLYFLNLLYQICGLVPGLGFIFTTVSGISQAEIVSSHIATAYMGSDHGMGTTCIADLYISMGVFSVMFFMYLLGRIFRKIEIGVYQDKIQFFYWVAYLSMFAYSVSIGRSDILPLFRNLIYISLIIYLTSRYNKGNGKQKNIVNN